jgi:hypothetical protein
MSFNGAATDLSRKGWRKRKARKRRWRFNGPLLPSLGHSAPRMRHKSAHNLLPNLGPVQTGWPSNSCFKLVLATFQARKSFFLSHSIIVYILSISSKMAKRTKANQSLFRRVPRPIIQRLSFE